MNTKLVCLFTISVHLILFSAYSSSSIETLQEAIYKAKNNSLTEIEKIAPNLARTGFSILSSVEEAAHYGRDEIMRVQIKTSHINRDLSESHITWLHQIAELKKNKPDIYGKIINPIKQIEENIIDKFYDIFITNKSEEDEKKHQQKSSVSQAKPVLPSSMKDSSDVNDHAQRNPDYQRLIKNGVFIPGLGFLIPGLTVPPMQTTPPIRPENYPIMSGARIPGLTVPPMQTTPPIRPENYPITSEAWVQELASALVPFIQTIRGTPLPPRSRFPVPAENRSLATNLITGQSRL